MAKLLKNRTMRASIIRVLDDEDAWEHVAMNYIAFIARGDHGCGRNANRIAKRLNRAIGDSMYLPKTWRKLPAERKSGKEKP